MKKILLVADISNLYYSILTRYKGRLNYSEYLKKAIGDNTLHRAIAYGASIEIDGQDQAAHFKTVLHHLGFELKYKTPKEYPTENPNRSHIKADWDVGIAIDVVQIVDSVDIVIFGSADGDLAPCLEYVKSRGKEAWVFACRISSDLKNIAHKWNEIPKELIIAE